MKKCLIYYFSGTGNTSIAASMLASNFKKYGYEVTTYRYQAPNKDIPSSEGYDLVGFGYPIHAFNVPGAFAKFIKALPKLSVPTKAFFFKVSGEPYHLNDASSHHIYVKLKRKGYQFIMDKHLLMPYNIMFRYPDGVAKQMYLYLNALTELMAKRLSLGEEDKIHYDLVLIFFSVLLRIEWIAPKLNCLFTHVDQKKCINCHLCIRECPTQSMHINKKGKIKVNSTCAMCMRCTYFCPKDAIKFGFMNNWKVNGPYQYQKLEKDDTVKEDYINRDTKDYFRHFKQYFYEQNQLLEKYHIPLPVTYSQEETILAKEEEKELRKTVRKA